MYGPEELINLFGILMRVFDLNLLDAKCPDGKSESPL